MLPVIVEVTPEIQEIAERRKALRGQLPNSIEKDEGSVLGYIGEIIMEMLVGGRLLDDSRNHDLLMPDGTRAEVKSKGRGVPPLSGYEVSVWEGSRHQRPDLYHFVSVQGDKRYGRWESYSRASYVGSLSYQEFWDEARLKQAGAVDQSSSNRHVGTADCYNRFHSDLCNLLPNDGKGLL